MIRFICKVGIIIIHKAVALRLATAFFVFVVGCFLYAVWCLRYRFFLSFWLNNTTAVTANTKARGTPHIKYPLSPVSITINGMHSNERRPVPRRRINR